VGVSPKMRSQIIAKPFWIDTETKQTYTLKRDIPNYSLARCEHWDSELEYKVYLALQGLNLSCTIHRQDEILVLPQNKHFHKWAWKIDFRLRNWESNTDIYVECKEQWMLKDLKYASFWKTLRILSHLQPEVYENLHFFGSSSSGEWLIPETKLKVYPLNKMKQILCRT
jgi:hypothetical protein